MENIYNRLVRDNIPDICISNNQKSKFRELDDLKYVSALNEELKEETKEYLADNSIDELAFGAINVKSELLLKIMVILVGVSFSVFVPVVNISIMTAAGMTSKVFAAANGCWTLLGNALSLAMPFVFNALQKNMGMQNATSMMCLAGVLTVVGALIYPSNKKIKAQAEAKA